MKAERLAELLSRLARDLGDRMHDIVIMTTVNSQLPTLSKGGFEADP